VSLYNVVFILHISQCLNALVAAKNVPIPFVTDGYILCSPHYRFSYNCAYFSLEIHSSFRLAISHLPTLTFGIQFSDNIFFWNSRTATTLLNVQKYFFICIKGLDHLSKKSSEFVLRKIFGRKFILESKNIKKNVWSRARFWDIIFWMEPCFYIFKEKNGERCSLSKKNSLFQN